MSHTEVKNLNRLTNSQLLSIYNHEGFYSQSVTFNPIALRDEASMLVIKANKQRTTQTIIVYELVECAMTITEIELGEQKRQKIQRTFHNKDDLLNGVILYANLALTQKGSCIV
jgi:hypothetical protein